MKAAVHTRYGPPEVVRIAEVDEPTPKDNELLVRVHATTVNQTDAHYRAAKPFIMRLLSGPLRPRATVLGTEFAGEVEAVGNHVTSFKAGDRVFGYNEGPFGAHAERLVIPEGSPLATIPANFTYEEAAPGTEGSHYALSHIRAARIRSGHDVLVYGATGAIGSAAVQLLKVLGAGVTAVCDTENLELVRSLGADRVVDYTAEDFTRDNQVYDLVFDAVGKSSFGRCRRLLKPHGIYTSTGPGPLYQNAVLLLVTPLFGGRKLVFSIPKIDQEMVGYFKVLMESGAFKPVVDRRYPLDQIVEAYRYVDTGRKVGNVVITVGPGHSPPDGSSWAAREAR
jgi:NADPH:quinone reductase-like Zn-dependent oxidoreductase